MSPRGFLSLVPLLVLPLIPPVLTAGPAFDHVTKVRNPWPDPGDAFGASVALSPPSLLAAGAPGEGAAGPGEGAVHLFRNGRFTATILPPGPSGGARFGAALAMDGHRVAVGAPRAAGGGVVYVYGKRGRIWQLEAEIRPADPDPRASFGLAVALDGDRLVVGAPFHPGDCAHCGAVYVFRHSADDWAQEARLTAPGIPTAALLGSAVAIEAPWIVAGAPYLGMEFLKGQAHTFRNTADGWVHHQRLPCTLCGGRDRLGGSVGIERGHVIAGAPRDAPPPFGFYVAYDADSDPATGEVVWEETATDVSPDPEMFDRFGSSVSMDGHLLLVGAPAAGDTGAAFLYRRHRMEWRVVGDLSPVSLELGEMFGAAVAVRANRAAVGAPQALAGGAGAGAVYLFRNAPKVPEGVPGKPDSPGGPRPARR